MISKKTRCRIGKLRRKQHVKLHLLSNVYNDIVGVQERIKLKYSTYAVEPRFNDIMRK